MNNNPFHIKNMKQRHCIEVRDDEESRQVQEILFSLGHFWAMSGTEFQRTGHTYLCFGRGSLAKASNTWESSKHFVENDARYPKVHKFQLLGKIEEDEDGNYY
jgi:hypothetical protein